MTKIKTRLLTLVCVVLFTLCVCGSVFATPTQWRNFPQQSISSYTNHAHAVQAILFRYDGDTSYYCDGIDGIFGSDTEKAVIVFQSKNGLSADGVVGANTWGALYGTLTPTNIDNNMYQNFRVSGGIRSQNAIASRTETTGSLTAIHWYAHGQYTSYIYCGV